MSARNAKNLQPALHELGSERRVTAVTVSPNANERAFLRDIFREAQWTLHEVSCFREALLLLRRRPVDLIITERDLEDGSWRDVLDVLKGIPACPALIVTSRFADEYLWAEVLNEGGFDVLAQPFDREEVVRVISAATRRTQNQYASRESSKVLTAGA